VGVGEKSDYFRVKIVRYVESSRQKIKNQRERNQSKSAEKGYCSFAPHPPNSIASQSSFLLVMKTMMSVIQQRLMLYLV
jgi:hypothetical protein